MWINIVGACGEEYPGASDHVTGNFRRRQGRDQQKVIDSTGARRVGYYKAVRQTAWAPLWESETEVLGERRDVAHVLSKPIDFGSIRESIHKQQRGNIWCAA
ncbi:MULTISPECIES: hypothetical protein [Gordonia]|uniref:hypothetical protein n=1 Tax=Gordonia TaxID=2053 RepID=UPI0011D1A1E9|nr:MULTISPECIES: hypothetical protein [Gordonia]